MACLIRSAAELSAASALTDAEGNASISATANALEGDYTVTATVAGLEATAGFALGNRVDAGDRIFADGFETAP